MKIAERAWTEGNKLLIHSQHDVTASLERSALLRSHGMGKFGESEAVASVPMVLVTQWLEAEGLSWDSPRDEIRKVILRNALKGEHSKFLISTRARP